jgi:hypothetical protein
MTTTAHKNLVVLARMLERLERSAVAVDAQQYRALVQHLEAELAAARSDAHLQAVLDNFPAAAELYENLHYANAGLCRSPLEPALAAEVQARALIDKLRREADQPKR